MNKQVSSVKGMNDILPTQMPGWAQVESALKSVMKQFSFQEIRFPIVEKTELFKRSIGDLTDIVQKEMYTFEDRHNGDLLTLRPEGTAACVRACQQHGLLYNQTQRLWYLGPMFRHERPQKGRYRQFHQFGVETFGYDNVAIEIELLSMNYKIWQALGIDKSVELHINTIGTSQERHTYQQALTHFLTQHKAALDDESLMRLEKNPLRILDTKNLDIQKLLKQAPKLHDYLSTESLSRFSELCDGLDKLGITYHHKPNLVRGLDYYSHSVFEWVTDLLGAQGTLSAGGRYDALVEQLGGKPTTAAGFAMGIERIVLLLETLNGIKEAPKCDIYVVINKPIVMNEVLSFVDKFRQASPHLSIMTDLSLSSMKSQLKRASASGAQTCLIFEEETFAKQAVSVKSFSDKKEIFTLSLNELINYYK